MLPKKCWACEIWEILFEINNERPQRWIRDYGDNKFFTTALKV